MRHHEKKTETRVYETLSHPTCDICGAKSVSRDNWILGGFNSEKVTIKHERATRYPECGWADTIEVDICPACFKDKLIPWLESQGVSINEVCTHS